jgi:hypothetical protein
VSTFPVRLPGCKISHTDAQALRGRLLVDALVGDLVHVRARTATAEGILAA